MKIIHCADVHLGSRMGRLPKAKAEERAREIRAAFNRVIEYAKDNGISNILLSGDVFDSDRPFKKDKEFFYTAVKKNPDISFYYLRGNHDGKESYTEQIDNLHTFSEQWTGYMLGGNVFLTGLEITAGNSVSMYSSLKLDPAKINIVMLHGSVDSGVGKDKINITKLRNKGIDYLALGHYHGFTTGEIDGRGAWAYSGCLEGRGFDETGKKGFIVYDTEEKTVCFIASARRTVEEIDVDVSGAKTVYEAVQRVKEQLKIDRDNLLRLNLTGEITFFDDALAAEIEKNIQDVCYLVSVKDGTKPKIDYTEYKNSLSLKGEFVRLVLEAEPDGEERDKILDTGLKALTGNL